MTTTVIGVLENPKLVGRVVDELVKAGLHKGDINVLEGAPDRIEREIVQRGFDEADARDFAQQAGRGKTLLAARTSDAKIDAAVAIMDRYEGVKGEENGESGERQRGETVQVVEEELQVGKRKTANGGVRVTSSVQEKPVEETVTLREEQVEAERRPVDRELRPEEAEEAFREKTVEMIGTSEEVEVRKEARVVEEVSLGKRTTEHEETVHDTVRRTDVEVEKIDGGAKKRR